MTKVVLCVILSSVLVGCAVTPAKYCPTPPAHLLTPIEYPAPLRNPVTVEKLKFYAIELEQKLDTANDRFELIRKDFSQ